MYLLFIAIAARFSVCVDPNVVKTLRMFKITMDKRLKQKF